MRVRCGSPGRTSTGWSSSAGRGRARGAARAAAPGGLSRARAHACRAGSGQGRASLVRRDAGRRPAVRRAPRHAAAEKALAVVRRRRTRASRTRDRTWELLSRRAPPPGPRRRRRRRRSLAGRPDRPGSRGLAGRARRGRPARRSRAAAAASSSCPTTATSPASTQPSPPRSARAGRHARLTADQGPQARYTAWLKVLRGHVRVVVGTRAAAFAPSATSGCSPGGTTATTSTTSRGRPTCTCARSSLRAPGSRGPPCSAVASSAPRRCRPSSRAVSSSPHCAGPGRPCCSASRVLVAGEGVELERDPAAASAHLPSVAWRTAKDALVHGPVLVQVPRRGYLPAMSLRQTPRPGTLQPLRRALALPAPDAAPPAAGVPAGRRTSAGTAGAPGCAPPSSGPGAPEELGRAFPGCPCTPPAPGEVLDRVSATPSLVIATPGAEPVADGGYAAVLLLDAWASLDRPVLSAGRRPCAAGWPPRRSAGARRGPRGRRPLEAPGHTTLPVVEALVRWDPAWFAERELADRRELHRRRPSGWRP